MGEVGEGEGMGGKAGRVEIEGGLRMGAVTCAGGSDAHRSGE